jgi:hypothetical protein
MDKFSNKQKTKRISLKVKILIFLVLFLLLVTGLVFLSNWQKVSITNIFIPNISVLDEKEVKQKADSFISTKFLYFFSRKNLLLYKKEDLVKYLEKEYPRIKNIKIESEGLNSLILEFSFREPHSLWCDNLPSEDLVSKCYFLDQTGFVYDKSPQFSGDVYFKYYGILPYNSPIGSYFLKDQNKFKDLGEFIKEAKKLQITPLHIIALNENEFEMYLFGGGKIIFDTNEPLLKTKERLSILLKTEGIFEKEKGVLNVEYIDLRFGDKLFYKEK